MNIKYQADADLKKAIVYGAKRRAPSLDFRTAHAANLKGLDDLAVLHLAAQGGRILISHDRRTMPGHFARFIAGHRSPGVFLISQNLPVSSAIDSLLLIWMASEASEWEDRLWYLPL